MSSEVRLGIKSKLYVNEGTYATPSWAEVNLVSDLQVNGAWDEGESSARISVVKTMEATQLALDLSGKIRSQYTDPTYRILYEAFIAADSVDILVLDGDKTLNGSTGFRFDGKVFSFSEDQSLGAVLYKDFTIKPCVADNVAKRALVASGTLAYDALGDTEATSFL